MTVNHWNMRRISPKPNRRPAAGQKETKNGIFSYGPTTTRWPNWIGNFWKKPNICPCKRGTMSVISAMTDIKNVKVKMIVANSRDRPHFSSRSKIGSRKYAIAAPAMNGKRISLTRYRPIRITMTIMAHVQNCLPRVIYPTPWPLLCGSTSSRKKLQRQLSCPLPNM